VNTREFPGVGFERFADDVVVHCVTERQAHQVRQAIGRRLADIGLQLHPDKTRLVYCKDDRRRLDYERVTFTFCGYAFRPRKAWDKTRGTTRTGFLPAVAPGKLTDMSRKVASWRLHRRTTWNLDDLAEEVNPALRGWLNYFTEFYPSAVIPIGKRVDCHLMRWARWKYKRLKRSEERARAWLKGVRQRSPSLFAHWTLRYTT
jgi:RNA-directed DNA polymerase